MYTAVLADGSRVTGEQCAWHDLPADARIASLGAMVSMRDTGAGVTLIVADDFFEGFDAYGFQMYDVQAVDGGEILGRGLQLLCVAGDSFLTVDINLSNGQRRARWQPLAAMTYNRVLLRSGIGR